MVNCKNSLVENEIRFRTSYMTYLFKCLWFMTLTCYISLHTCDNYNNWLLWFILIIIYKATVIVRICQIESGSEGLGHRNL